ncbi:hypothetical protein GQX73_g6325 [Xylaria multiplex]|uniref:DUF676 domain-containing protein n=1 Tax=Xylaria multiplex TaxID=323545 RepID=A0A7C8IMA8_9PEZI|nr:hypothetical protein GQX73_g6325 [Xylaria multiplex]
MAISDFLSSSSTPLTSGLKHRLKAADRGFPPEGKNFLKIFVDPPDANVDVVAVHGLNPLNNSSHAVDTWASEGKLWLSDFLPKRVPRARICLFGYNSNIAFGTGSAGDNPNRPLIFICHSLGGLIIKRAMVHAKADDMYNQIWKSTFGLVFFATPQQGGNHAGFGDIVAGIVRSISRNPGNTFMATLKSNSTVLNTITDDFRQMLEDFQILSFYETRPLGSFGIVVDHKSALLGLPGTRERQIAVDADHRGICKFASEDDPRYKLVEDNIAQMIMNATSSGLKGRLSGEVACVEVANISHISGESNTITQAGHSNQSVTIGAENRTNQFGQRNRCEVEGTSNTTTQFSMEPAGIFLLGLKLLLDKWY